MTFWSESRAARLLFSAAGAGMRPRKPGLQQTLRRKGTGFEPSIPPERCRQERSEREQRARHAAREGGHHQCTVIDQECRQDARFRDASDKEGKPVVFSVGRLVMPGLRADAIAKPTGMEPESSVARYSAMSS